MLVVGRSILGENNCLALSSGLPDSVDPSLTHSSCPKLMTRHLTDVRGRQEGGREGGGGHDLCPGLGCTQS